MAHVRRVISVAGEAAPEVVELVDRLERLAFHDRWWKQSSRCLPLHWFDGFVSELAPSGGRALSRAAPASSVHRQSTSSLLISISKWYYCLVGSFLVSLFRRLLSLKPVCMQKVLLIGTNSVKSTNCPFQPVYCVCTEWCMLIMGSHPVMM